MRERDANTNFQLYQEDFLRNADDLKSMIDWFGVNETFQALDKTYRRMVPVHTIHSLKKRTQSLLQKVGALQEISQDQKDRFRALCIAAKAAFLFHCQFRWELPGGLSLFAERTMDENWGNVFVHSVFLNEAPAELVDFAEESIRFTQDGKEFMIFDDDEFGGWLIAREPSAIEAQEQGHRIEKENEDNVGVGANLDVPMQHALLSVTLSHTYLQSIHTHNRVLGVRRSLPRLHGDAYARSTHRVG